MAQEQLYGSTAYIFDAENQSLSDDKLTDIRFEEEEEDELTRKIKAIPILPRIPKIKKSSDACDEDSTKRGLEYRSVLHRKEFFMNTDDALKWPSTEIQSFDRPKKRVFSHNSEKKSSLERPNGSFALNNRDSCMYTDRRRSNGRNLPNCLTAEEKFDQITKNKEPGIKIQENCSLISESSNQSGEQEKTSNEFDRFENSLLSDMPVKPYKTLEERRLERIKNGLLQNTAKSCIQNGNYAKSSPDVVNKDVIDNDTSSQDFLDAKSNTVDRQCVKSNSTKEATSGEGSSSSSDFDSQMEVVDMEIVNSPCEDSLDRGVKSATVRTALCRKVTFDCPEGKESKANLTLIKEGIKKHENSKKNNCQERVVTIMKDFLKPFYSKQKISKEDYKEIMRKTVPKFSKNRTEDIRKDKIERYAEKYVKMLIHKKKKA